MTSPPHGTDYSWWSSLKHGGVLIAPARLQEFFPDEIEPLNDYKENRLRRDVTRLNGSKDTESAILDTVLEVVLPLGHTSIHKTGEWLKGRDLGTEWTRRAVAGEAVRPRRVWLGRAGGQLPVFWSGVTRIGIGRGRRDAARVIEWLRKGDQKVALLTNGRQWRLVYAGLDHDAFAEWDVDLFFEEGRPGPQVAALRILLAQGALEGSGEEEPGKLLQAIEASRRGQAEVSSALGERVRQVVELLIQEHGTALSELDDVERKSIYLAAVRMIMRMVVVLFAEARDLLPRDNPAYHASYGLQGLREYLDSIGGGSGAERLRHRDGAWPRILGLFGLVFEGSPHPGLPVPRYGGGLFTPGAIDSDDPVLRAIAAFEDRENAPRDATVYRILRLLTQAPVKVRQGGTSTWLEAPVDFSDLSSEYIGILYEGLLDYELRQAPDGDSVVFLNLGDQPALPLSRLEALEDKQLAALVEKFGKPSKGPVAEKDAEEEEEQEEESPETEEPLAETAEEPADDAGGDAVSEDDHRQEARTEAEVWACRAVIAGRLVAKPRGKLTQEKKTAYEDEVKAAAGRLVHRVVLPGEWYLVRYAGTRKGSGTFYTKPGLAIPTVHRTLRPLAFSAPTDPNGEVNELASPSEWTVRQPEAILALRVCDPACGSGSFLVGALRFLTEALRESLHAHSRIEVQGEHTLVTLAEGNPGGDVLGEEVLPCRPEDEVFDDRLEARLKRWVVERCIYGVDLDPLAVELCQLALWVETMDRELPFSFLDHKIKCGNSLVGCWFDRFRDYPAMAFEREGGDKTHSNGVHFEKNAWTKAIRDFRNNAIKPALADWIRGQSKLFTPDAIGDPQGLHDAALAALEQMHSLRPDEVEAKERLYRDEIVSNEGLEALRQVFDGWCALWFWPPSELGDAPLPERLLAPGEHGLRVIRRLRQEYRFFHWELEFPDVFAARDSGFDAILGNPPWDIQKTNSKEFFSNLDPLYRAYGKQEGLVRQTQLFEEEAVHEERWLLYQAAFKSLSSFFKHSAFPFGDPEAEGDNFSIQRGKANVELHMAWRSRRRASRSYADPAHPYQYQGSADINLYKLFLEQSHHLLADGRRMGLITPSGVYSDKGTAELRRLFLEQCRWRWLFGFENRAKIFDIDSRFKFSVSIVEKGGATDLIRSTFMQRELGAWEDAENHVLEYALDQVKKFSPASFAILELQNRRDLEIIEKVYANSVSLGDRSDDGWNIKYGSDFHMTNDSSLFPPLPEWENRGYKPDEYSRWLLGMWRKRENGSPAPPDANRWELEPGVILSRDQTEWIHGSEVADTALPLCEGRMIGQFDFSAKGWVSGKGRGAVWRELHDFPRHVEPQYLIDIRDALDQVLRGHATRRVAIMDIGSATNTRTMYASYLDYFPSGHSAPLLSVDSAKLADQLALTAVFNSLVFDWQLRVRLGGLHLTWHYLEELYMPPLSDLEAVVPLVASLNLVSSRFAGEWLRLREEHPRALASSWTESWAIDSSERLRLRCLIDAVVANAYGISSEDYAWIIRDCALPEKDLANREYVGKLNPKGFWRVDRRVAPEWRHPNLALVALRDLEKRLRDEDTSRGGIIRGFVSPASDGGWMFPKSLVLTDCGLEQVSGANRKRELPRASLTTQEVGVIAGSWTECQLHACNLGSRPDQLRVDSPDDLRESVDETDFGAQTRLALDGGC